MRPIRLIALSCVLSLLICGPSDAASKSKRGVEITSRPSPSLYSLYNHSYAVVIGINAYDKWPSLEYAVNDARSIEKRFKDMGFDTITLLDNNATRENILKVLGDELPKKVEKNDRVIIFFAGHGQTEELSDGSQMGYIVPVDSDTRNIFSTAISMDQVRQFSRRLPAKHVLYLIDACYSGLGLTRSGGIPPSDRDYLNKITKRKAHQMLTAGGKGEQAHEEAGHGIFTKYVLEGLDGSADRDGKGYITFSDLASYVKPKVTRETRSSQVPQYGSIDGEGEFVFVLTNTTPSEADVPTVDTKTVSRKPERIERDRQADLKAEPDLSSAVTMVKNAVVKITVSHTQGKTPPPFFKGDQFKGDEFFDRFFGKMPQNAKPEANAVSAGSGFIISRDGFILTSNHVIEGGGNILVTLLSGKEYAAKIIGKDPLTSVALIKVNADANILPAELGDSDRVEMGQRVIALGYPFALQQTVSSGIVSATGGNLTQKFIQTDISFRPGSGGGPLVNTEGKVIGINMAILQEAQGIGFAIPINTAKSILADLKTRGKVTRGFLGVHVQDVTDEMAQKLALSTKSGALVVEVDKGSPADKAGILAGDLVVEAKGRKIEDTNQFVSLIASLAVGETVRVKVLRDSRPRIVRAIIAERQY